MGGTLLIQMQSKKEVLRFRDFVFSKNGGRRCNIILPNHPKNPSYWTRERGAFVEAPDMIYGATYVGLDYAIWDRGTADFVIILAEEMIKGNYFKVKRIGWDSVGMCKSLSEFLRSRILWERRAEIGMLKKFKNSTQPVDIQFIKDNWPDEQEVNKILKQMQNEIDATTRRFRYHARRFFTTDSPDLVLG